jgi:hypothetical protein
LLANIKRTNSEMPSGVFQRGWVKKNVCGWRTPGTIHAEWFNLG